MSSIIEATNSLFVLIVSLDSFLLAVLKIFDFGKIFINWIENTLNEPESCTISNV